MVKNPSAMQETGVRSLGQEDPRRREWPLTQVLPGESHEQRGLAGYSPWARKELDTTEVDSVALRHVGSEFLDQGSNLCLLHWKADS